MREKLKTIFVSDVDEQEFDTAVECQYHEAMKAEESMIEAFLDTQRWDPQLNKGYADRTLTTMRSIMKNFIKYKVEQKLHADNAPAQTGQTNSGAEVQS